MEYIKIRLTNKKEEFNSKFEKAISEMLESLNPRFILSQRQWKPAMDIYETPNEVIVLAELAGVTKENIDVEIGQRAIKITGKRQCYPLLQNARYNLAEIQYGHFERTLFFPSPVNTENVKAICSNGLLEIRLQKIPINIVRKVNVEQADI
ncbi:MAG: Hsp20/alpha crystallin family protein [Desulfobacterales bacterium]|nr:Hsp20/alpha crystallin family protein [Desulfobacterales bacterium]